MSRQPENPSDADPDVAPVDLSERLRFAALVLLVLAGVAMAVVGWLQRPAGGAARAGAPAVEPVLRAAVPAGPDDQVGTSAGQVSAGPSTHGRPMGAAAQGSAGTAVQVVRPQPAAGQRRLSATGSVAARQEWVVASEVQGLRLLRLPAAVGSRVRAGDVLAEFDTSVLQAERARTQAQLEEARAAAEQAAQNRGRAVRLQDTGVLSGQQEQAYITEERSARARVAALVAADQLHRLQMQRATVRAPEDGVVVSRQAVPGAVVTQGQELMRLIRQGLLEWRAEVEGQELAQLRPGQLVTVVVGELRLQGRVREAAPQVDAATRNGIAHVDLPAHPGLRPGLFARGEFELPGPTGHTVPLSAVVMRGGQAQVLVVDERSRVQLVPVELGRRLGDRIELRAGPGPQALVVASGGQMLAEGDAVRVLPGPEAAR